MSAETIDPTVMVSVENMGKSFNDLRVLDGIDFTVRKGEVVLLLGPSGSGKSTLLRTLNCLESIDSGVVRICGETMGFSDDDRRHPYSEARIAKQRHHTGMVFQTFNLFPMMTALDNVASGPRHVLGTSTQQARGEAQELLAMVGLADRADHYPAQLSGGEQQRVALARAFSTLPKVLFADEPTGNLDARTGAGIIDLMTELNRDLGTTLVLVTHDLDLAGRARRTIRLADGRIVADTAA